MSARVAAAYCLAAFILGMPAVSNGEANAVPDADAPAVFGLVAASDQTEVQPQDRAQARPQDVPQEQTEYQTGDRANDDPQATVTVAALDPVEPSDRSPAAPQPVIQSSSLGQPFGLNGVPVMNGELLTKWNGVEADIRAESEILARCSDSAEPCPRSARSFLAIVAQGRAQTGRARIGIINRAINMAIRPMSDLAQWGEIDHWSAPLETLATGLGDCEDYAIAKYVALRRAGVAAEDVRLVIVRNLAADEDHAVVAARLEGDWIILDNRWLTLLEDNEMRQVIPLFVLDQTGIKELAPVAIPVARGTAAPHGGVATAPGSVDF
jgi:predicted transglutaminase-like cysteine proteinase